MTTREALSVRGSRQLEVLEFRKNHSFPSLLLYHLTHEVILEDFYFAIYLENSRIFTWSWMRVFTLEILSFWVYIVGGLTKNLFPFKCRSGQGYFQSKLTYRGSKWAVLTIDRFTLFSQFLLVLGFYLISLFCFIYFINSLYRGKLILCFKTIFI